MVKSRENTKKKPTKKLQIELSSLSALLWGVFFFFLLIWIFVLGILVGRGFLPGNVTTITELKGQIKRLQNMVVRKEIDDTTRRKEPDEMPKLVFYDRLASKKDEVKKALKTEKQADITKKETPLAGPGTAPKKTNDELEEDSLGPQKSEIRKDSLKPQDLYTVQVASLGDMDSVERMIKELIEKGYDAYYYEAKVNGKDYYRIRCGKFQSREEADNYLRKLEEAGFKGFVSRNE